MALTMVDKVKITGYLKDHAIDDIYYYDLCDAIGKRGKVSDVEFLEHFTDTVVKEFRKNEKISIKQLSKLISIIDNFLGWMHEDGKEIDEGLLDIIRSFEDLYDDYLNRNNYDIDLEFTDNIIGEVLKTVNKLYPSKSSGNESLGKYINRIAELEEELSRVKRELAESIRLYGLLEECHKKNSEKLEVASQSVIDLGRESKSKSKDIEVLNQTIEELNNRVVELEEVLTSSKDEVAFFEPFKQKCEELSNEVTRLNGIIADDIREQTEAVTKRLKETQMEAIIYQKLLFDGSNIDGLIKSLQSKGFVTERDEVFGLLQRIKSKINVSSSTFSFSPSYKIVSPKVEENGEFKINVPVGCKHYDVMLVSDFHIKDIDSKVLTGFDVLNNYCANHGINLILNLGDFFQGTAGHTFEYDYAISNYKVVEKSISMIPRAEGIYHAVLGGNHDRNIVKYGFDPITMLCDGREDFINLGYNHSTIALNGFYNPLGKFDIHHPDVFDFPIDLDDEGLDLVDIRGYLDDVYKKQGRSRDDSYIDIFGHTHKSQFNYPGQYCYIPSYFEGKGKRGACHLRIYFDEETDIKYMVFMPMAYNDKLVKGTEIIYEKVLKK